MHTYRKSTLGGRGTRALPDSVMPCWRQSGTKGMDFEEEVATHAPVTQPRRKRSLSAFCCSSGASSASQVQLSGKVRAFLYGARVSWWNLLDGSLFVT